MDGLLFAEKFLRVVTTGDHHSTYKMATAIALLQVAQEIGVDVDSASLPSRRVAEVVIDLYSIQLGALDRADTLRQMNRADQSSRILDAVLKVADQTRSRSRRPEESAAYEQVVREVEDGLLAVERLTRQWNWMSRMSQYSAARRSMSRPASWELTP